MSARLSPLRNQHLPFFSKSRPAGTRTMIRNPPIPASSHPFFSITYTLSSIHNLVYLSYFLATAHSSPKTPGIGSSAIKFPFALQPPSNLSLAKPLSSKPHRIYLLQNYSPPTPIESISYTIARGGGSQGVFPPIGHAQTQGASRSRSSKKAIGAA